MSIKRISSWHWPSRKRQAIDLSKTGFSRTKGLGLDIVHKVQSRTVSLEHPSEQAEEHQRHLITRHPVILCEPT